MEPTVPLAVLEAKEREHRAELAKLALQLARYRMTLEQHGIEPPDRTGAELVQMWRDCAQVVSTTTQFASSLGSARELIDEWGIK